MVFQQNQTIESILGHQLEALLGCLRPRRLLLIGSGLEPLSRQKLQHGALKVQMELAGDRAEGSLVCRTGNMPFRDGEFDLVVAQHMLGDGREPELHEFCRVIRPGGQLLVIGAGRYCGTRKQQEREQPSMNVASVIRALRSHDFEIRQCQGIGLRRRPVCLEAGWQKPLLKFSNLILVRGKHQGNHAMVTPLRFSRPGTGRVQVPALDSLSREAAR